MLAADAPGLRAWVLAGRHSLVGQHSLAGGEAQAGELARFLAEDRGALWRWFGPAAAALRHDPLALRGRVDRDIAAIDDLIAAQLDAVLHHERLQRLEGSWRGLAWLVEGVEPWGRVRVSMLAASWRDLARDLARASEFDQSNLFRLVYENEFGHAGGEPFGLLVVDHEVRHRAAPRRAGEGAPVDDVTTMGLLASIAAAAFVPVVLAASPALLGVDRFEELALARAISAPLGDGEHAPWRSLASREDSRFLCLTAPRVLARPRWTAESNPLGYEEHAPGPRQRVWSVAGYAFASVVARAHLAHNWPADVRGVATDRVGGGLVLRLGPEEAVLGAATRWARASTELSLTDPQERDLAAAGFMPLNTLPYGDAAFGSVHSLHARAPAVPGREPTAHDANRRLSAEIGTMLCVSRFAHHLKIIGREMTGSQAGAADVERRLQLWLARYVNTSPSPDASARARHPLLSGRVRVHENAGQPGALGCVIHLQPYYQIDDVSMTFRLVTSLGPPGADAARGGAAPHILEETRP